MFCIYKVTNNINGKPNLKNRGRKMTTEQIEHNREIQIKLRKEHPEYWETEAYLNRGKKVSISKIGHTVSEETRKKISETLKSKKYKENV